MAMAAVEPDIPRLAVNVWVSDEMQAIEGRNNNAPGSRIAEEYPYKP
jgi:hypothetical protein